MRLKRRSFPSLFVMGAFILVIWLTTPGALGARGNRRTRGTRIRGPSSAARTPRGTGDNYYDRTSCPDSYEQYYSGGGNPTSDSQSFGDRRTLPSASDGQSIAVTRKSSHRLAHLRNKPEIKIGFLGTFYQGRMLGKLVVGAMPLAVHDVNMDKDVLPNHSCYQRALCKAFPLTATLTRQESHKTFASGAGAAFSVPFSGFQKRLKPISGPALSKCLRGRRLRNRFILVGSDGKKLRTQTPSDAVARMSFLYVLGLSVENRSCSDRRIPLTSALWSRFDYSFPRASAQRVLILIPALGFRRILDDAVSRLTFVAENVGLPESSGGVKKMTDLRNQSVKAFIGPDESCYAEALVADAWNLPMITYVRMWVYH
ncbi:guanylate cyclase 32E-like [Tropilaelaps mercedesae]|uniref:Guanylate cyclase 32E-like n=1 Tax=Tropilaelaps mercedesae TaxID=418985 RepID=A0A1V9XM03_9ACAR|nr:guanylate cyclase 32E-like [Tropilaelaps mercedesae]